MVAAIRVLKCIHRWQRLPMHLARQALTISHCTECGEEYPGFNPPAVSTKWVRKPWWKPALLFTTPPKWYDGRKYPEVVVGPTAEALLEAEEDG